MYAHSQGWQRELRHECVSVMAAEVHSMLRGTLPLDSDNWTQNQWSLMPSREPNTRSTLTDIRPYVQSAV